MGEERDGRRANMTAVIREQPRIGGEGKRGGKGREKMIENERKEKQRVNRTQQRGKLAVRNGVACQRRGERKIRRVNN